MSECKNTATNEVVFTRTVTWKSVTTLLNYFLHSQLSSKKKCTCLAIHVVAILFYVWLFAEMFHRWEWESTCSVRKRRIYNVTRKLHNIKVTCTQSYMYMHIKSYAFLVCKMVQFRAKDYCYYETFLSQITRCTIRYDTI